MKTVTLIAIGLIAGLLIALAILVWPGPQILDAVFGQEAAPANVVQAAQTPMVVTATTEPAVAPAAKMADVCPTEREFFELTGVRADVVSSEPCAFHWRGDPLSVVPRQICPQGWICTVGVTDWQGGGKQTIVMVGDDIPSVSIFAATWRLTGLYPAGDAVHNKCVFLAKVQGEGRISDPTWTALPGNFTCP